MRLESDGKTTDCNPVKTEFDSRKALHLPLVIPLVWYYEQVKRCSTCKMEKSLSDFYSDRSRSDGKTRLCKDCTREYNKVWRERNPEHARELWRQASRKHAPAKRAKKYGLSTEELECIRERQNSCCAICGIHETDVKGRTPGVLCVDHDHATGNVRGLLCGKCNTALGMFGDTEDGLLRAVEYLIGTTPQ